MEKNSVYHKNSLFWGYALLLVVLAEQATAEGVDKAQEQERRARFMQKCEQTEFNDQCAQFYESQLAVRRSERFCLERPDEPSCQDRLRELEVNAEQKRELSLRRELDAYCRENADAPRCLSRKAQRPRTLRASF